MNTSSIERARVLLEHSKVDQAEKELRLVLMKDPDNITAMGLMAICLIDQNRHDEALSLTRRLITHDADNAYNFYILGIILYKQEKINPANDAAMEAIKKDPNNADYFALMSDIFMLKKEWTLALQRADEGLHIDPDNLHCLNNRSAILSKLNRNEEAAAAMTGTLEKDPENAYSHTNIGWTKLQQGNYKEARIHFAEALRIDPTIDSARAGIVEALKAKNILYRIFLNFFFWLEKFKGKSQWAIIIGMYLGFKVIRSAARSYPVLMPFVIVVAIFFYLTWIIGPLFNLFLRLDPQGKYALTEDEVKGSNIVGLCLALMFLSLGLWYFLKIDEFIFISIFAGTIVIPLARFFGIDTEKEKKIIKPFAIGLTIVGITGVILNIIGLGLGVTFGTIYIVGIIAFGWVANSIAIKTY